MLSWLGFGSPSPRPYPAADLRLEKELSTIRSSIDHHVATLLLMQWAVVMLASFILAPAEKLAETSHLVNSVLWNGLLTGAPLWMLLRFDSRRDTRLVLALSQGMYSTLLLCDSFGQVETMFHLFVWLIVLALYRDAALVLTAVSTALVTQAAMGWAAQGTSLHFFANPMWRERAIWVGVETAFLIVAIKHNLGLMSAISRREAALESLNNNMERKVERRTRTFQDEQRKLAAENNQLRDLRMKAQSDEVAATRSLLELRDAVDTHTTKVIDLMWGQSEASLPEGIRPAWREIRDSAQWLMQHASSGSQADSQDIGLHQFNIDSSEQLVDDEDGIELTTTPVASVERVTRALLLMDDPVQVSLTNAALEEIGVDATVVRTGPRTYYSTLVRDFDAVLIDVDLPNDEGFDTVEALRTMPGTNLDRTKIIALSSNSSPETVLRLTALSIDGIIQKPATCDRIRSMLSIASEIREDDPEFIES